MMIKPRYYQDLAINAPYEYFMSRGKDAGNPLILMPTASGKTIVIAGFIFNALRAYPRSRFIVATHVKELIKQNADKFGEMWPHAPYGIHSAGLKSRDTMQPIIFGGIQSMIKHVEAFGFVDILFIDEAHLVSPDDGTRYQAFIAALKKRNSKLKVIGLSATGYRQGIGMITDEHEGRIFTDVCIDLTSMEWFGKLIGEGFLSPLISKRTSIEIDVSEINMGANGDYNQKQLQAAANRERITHAALREAIAFGADNRRSWLIFASGVEHAENVNAMLNSFGISSVVVHSKITPEQRDERIRWHKAGHVRAMVGNNIFTTGYDHPPLDFIVDLQPTMSTAKHVQKYGRGMRPSPATYKNNCLVLDFGANTRRLGPINDPVIPRRKGEGTGEAPVKICEHCNAYNHPSARECISCGEPFEFKTKILKEASTAPVMKSEVPQIEWFDVNTILYYKHIAKSSGIPTMRVCYFCGMQAFDEWVGFDNPKTRWRASKWWKMRHASETPKTVDEALTMTQELKVVKRIKVWLNKTHPEVLEVRFF